MQSNIAYVNFDAKIGATYYGSLLNMRVNLSRNCFCAYPLFQRGNIIQNKKMFKRGLKKCLKNGGRVDLP